MNEKKYKEFLSEFGRRGGEALKAKKAKEDPDYYKRITALGREKRWGKKNGDKSKKTSKKTS